MIWLSSFKIKFSRHIVCDSLSQALVHGHEENAFNELELVENEDEETRPESHKSFTALKSVNDGMFSEEDAFIYESFTFHWRPHYRTLFECC